MKRRWGAWASIAAICVRYSRRMTRPCGAFALQLRRTIKTGWISIRCWSICFGISGRLRRWISISTPFDATPEDVSDELIQALLPFGEKAVGPLLSLYEELGEEQGSDVAFVLAGLRVRDPRIFEMLLDRLEYDAADGAFCLGLYGDPAARPALEKCWRRFPRMKWNCGAKSIMRSNN